MLLTVNNYLLLHKRYTFMDFKTSSKLFVACAILILATTKSIAQKAVLTVNQDSKIVQLLNLKKELEKENKLSDGYTIQLYYGELDKANKILKNYRSSFENWPATIGYETPNFKVWVGNFDTRIEAERALIEIQKKFASAFILKPENRK